MKHLKNEKSRSHFKELCLFFLLGFIIAFVFKDIFTPLMFGGKTFFGRSLLVKFLILFGSAAIITALLYLIKGIISLQPFKGLQHHVSKFLLSIVEFHAPFAKINISWSSFFIMVLLSLFLYIFFEWLFIITKPSFLTLAPFTEKLSILGFTISIIFLSATILILLVYIIFRKQRLLSVPKYLLIIPAIIFSLTLLLLVDDFTYTLFEIGIITASNFGRSLYSAMLTAAIFLIWKDLLKFSANIDKTINQTPQNLLKIFTPLKYIVIFILFFSPVIFINRLSFSSKSAMSNIENNVTKNKPHIVLITIDGVNAKNTSLYGYERDTTPFLTEFSKEALLAENAFPNAAHTSGSLTSIFTSKYPTTTKVLYPPDILRGMDSYQHLPGLLKSLGYQNTQYGTKHYLDAFQLNMRQGFDVVNGRDLQKSSTYNLIGRYFDDNTSYFFYELYSRLTNPLGHIFFLNTMEDIFEQVTKTGIYYNDLDKFENALMDLKNSSKPQFIHIHTMKTHGPKFYPTTQIFSSGQDFETQGNWDIDLYDDCILEFDQQFAYFWDQLNQIGEQENTIIIITSDHGRKYVTIERIPFLIRFPNSAHSGLISTNVQNLDITPTVLSYLGLNIPDWIEGYSLMDKKEKHYPIISVGTKGKTVETVSGWELSEEKLTPPFYQFSYMMIIDCHKWYQLNLDKLIWTHNELSDHSNHCPEENLLSFQEISDLVIDRLCSDGFDLNEDTLTKIRTPSQ